MARDTLDELVEFLRPGARVDLKHLALEHLVGVSGTEDGVIALLSKDALIKSVMVLCEDKVDEVAKNALLFLVNVSANAGGATELIKYSPISAKNFIEMLISYVLNPNKKDADAACMILSNVTRVDEVLDTCVDLFLPHMSNILNAFVNTEFNKKGCSLDYLSPMFSNLSCSARVRKWLTEEKLNTPILKILPFCNYKKCNIRRGGAIATIRNLSFDTEYHSFLISSDLDLLTHLLMPVIGNEEYTDEETETLPVALQYLPKEKARDPDVDIRKMIIETLNKLCAKRDGREFLRENGVYYVMREYHKWEKNPLLLLACENLVDILIQKEHEVGAEDLSTVEVPEELANKFEAMDEDYTNHVE